MMEPKRRWKYEKDIFGRKHRKYFLENVFGTDIYDMKTFRALKKKLSRDYKVFFGSLNKLYEKGEFKNIAKDSLSLVNRVITLVDNIVESGIINKKDVDVIVQHVDMLNSRKDILVQKSEQVKALKDRLSKIEGATGIRPEDLDITEKIIRTGARREAKKGREGALPFLKRTMPKTFGLAGQLGGGLATAALGPFAPIAKAVGGFGRDIFGLGMGISQKLGERKERKLGRALAPLSAQLPREELERIGGARERGGILSGAVKSRRTKEGSAVLKEFFNRDAYRAKWTKELLKRMKDVTSKGKGSIIDALKSFAGKAGGILGTAGIVGGTVLAAGKVGWDLGKAIGDYTKALSGYAEAQDRSAKANQMWLDHFNKLREEVKKDQPIINQVTERIETRKQLLEAAPKKLEKNAFVLSPTEKMKQIQKESTQILTEIQKGGAEKLSVEQRKKFLELSGTPVPASQEELLSEVKKLTDSITGLSKSVKDTSKRPSSIREPGIGNPWDSSDPLINSLAGSELEMEE